MGLFVWDLIFHSATLSSTRRWPLDYFIKAHTAPDEFYVQVGDQADQAYWGPPESMPTPRTPYK